MELGVVQKKCFVILHVRVFLKLVGQLGISGLVGGAEHVDKDLLVKAAVDSEVLVPIMHTHIIGKSLNMENIIETR
jgi:hypothetical protein